MTGKRREAIIAYINRFNVATFADLRTWPNRRLNECAAFIRDTIKRARAAYGAR